MITIRHPSSRPTAAAAAVRERMISARLRWLAIALGLLALALLGGALAPFAVPAPALAADAAETLIERGRWKEARALLEPRVAANPSDAVAAYLLSRVRTAFHDAAGALALAEKSVQLDGSNARYHEQLAMVLGEKAESAGKLQQIGLAKRFKKSADAAVALDPRRFDAQMALMIFHLKAPGIIGGDRKAARAKPDEIAKLDSVRGELARARYAAETKDSVAALAHAMKAVEVGPQDYSARVGLASRLFARGDGAAAERNAIAARQIDPGRGAAYALLAGIYAKDSRWAELDAVLVQAEANVPGNLLPHYSAARVLLTESREPARAERYLRRYLAVEPEGGAPLHPGARWRLAQALEKQGRKGEAIAELEAAVHARPDFDEAKKDLKRLRKAT